MKLLIELDVAPGINDTAVCGAVSDALTAPRHPFTVVSVTPVDMELRKVKADLDHLDAIVSEL